MKKLTEERRRKGETIKPSDVPYLIFGGGGSNLRNAFEEGFGLENNISVWKTIGIHPFDRNCLSDKKVKHEVIVLESGVVDIDADPLTTTLLNLQKQNQDAVDFLNKTDCDGNQFLQDAPMKRMTQKIAVTVPHSRERQDALASASTAGKRFIATGGDALNADDYFIAEERKRRVEKKKLLEEKRKNGRQQ